jgi:nicotinamide N-methyltransferase
LLSDLVFNHSQHAALLDSCLACLSSSPSTSPVALVPSSTSLLSIDISLPTLQTPAVLCFYSHHRPTPELIAADLGFIALAREKGWKVHKVWEDPKAGVSFSSDPPQFFRRAEIFKMITSPHFRLTAVTLILGAQCMDGL